MWNYIGIKRNATNESDNSKIRPSPIIYPSLKISLSSKHLTKKKINLQSPGAVPVFLFTYFHVFLHEWRAMV